MSDLRYAIRGLARTPSFTIVAILSLALGIGANVTIYTIANAFLEQPIGGAQDVDRLVRIYRGGHSPLQYADLVRVREQRRAFSDVAGERMMGVAVANGGGTERVQASITTEGYFRMLGVRPELGRLFGAADSVESAPVVVVSHAFWQNRLGGDSAIIGRNLRVNDRSFTIIGVAPPEFASSIFLWRADLWLPPRAAAPLIGMPFEQWGGSLYTTARLARGASPATASARLATVAARLVTEDPTGHERFTLRLDHARGIQAELRPAAIVASTFMMTVVVLVLLIACANVANLLLARATARRREISVRTALGAGRGRLVRQLLTESVLVAVAGGALGLLLATWAAEVLRNFAVARSPEPIALDVSPDVRVLAFTLGASVLSAIGFGLMPALRATSLDILPVLREDAPQTTGRSRTRRVLIAAQMAFCTLLLACATLFLRSLANARVIDPGFDARGVYDVALDVSSRNLDRQRTVAFYDALRTRAAALPGARSATIAAVVPLGGSNMQVGSWIEGQDAAPGGRPPRLPYFNIVGPDYFETLGIPTVAGRAFAPTDIDGAPGVVVINAHMAAHTWRGDNPLGKRISIDGPSGPWLTVVGIVRDTKYNSLGESTPDFMFLPFAQHSRAEMVLQVRMNRPGALAATTIRDLVHDLDPLLPPPTVASLEDDMRIVLLPAQLAAGLLSAFGMLALLIASVGIYGVASYEVAQRTRELGIRAALGATARDLVELVVRQSMRVVLIGALVGLVFALGAARLLTTQLYGVGATDPVTFLGMPLFLALVAMVATLVPARRATRVDPVEALRAECVSSLGARRATSLVLGSRPSTATRTPTESRTAPSAATSAARSRCHGKDRRSVTAIRCRGSPKRRRLTRQDRSESSVREAAARRRRCFRQRRAMPRPGCLSSGRRQHPARPPARVRSRRSPWRSRAARPSAAPRSR
jgi:predicted permease